MFGGQLIELFKGMLISGSLNTCSPHDEWATIKLYFEGNTEIAIDSSVDKEGKVHVRVRKMTRRGQCSSWLNIDTSPLDVPEE